MPFNFGKFNCYGNVLKGARISQCERYRYLLQRKYQEGGNGKRVLFIMLNPSTADADQDDPTIRRCLGFTRFWGYTLLDVVNLFSYRTTDPKELLTAYKPIGDETDGIIGHYAGVASLIVCAWGRNALPEREEEVLEILRYFDLYCLGLTKNGKPKHPLYVPKDTKPIPFIP